VTRPAALSVLASCLLLAACDLSRWVEAPPPPVVTVCTIDVSLSVRGALRAAARDVCVREVASAPAGAVIVRVIDGESAMNEAEVVRVLVPDPIRCDNPFAPRCRSAARERDEELARARAAAVEEIRAVRPRAGATDLVGALAAAAAELAQAEDGARRRLVVISDIDDTAGRATNLTLLRLDATDVVVHVQEPADPAVGERRKAAFAALVTAAGARSVRFVPLSPNY
jgi:hypothetical protein